MKSAGLTAPAFPKFQKINSREEKEMSSIKTLSSFSFPAEKKTGNQDGSVSSGEEDSGVVSEGEISFSQMPLGSLLCCLFGGRGQHAVLSEGKFPESGAFSRRNV